MNHILPGVPSEASWKRAVPRHTLPAQVLTRIIDSALPHRRVLDIQPLAGGLRNANFKVHLSSASEPLVLRIYEHDQSLCQKEVDLFRLLSGSVPVPEIIHAEPRGLEEIPPFALARYVEGVTFLELKRNGDTEALAQAAFSAGEVLAGVVVAFVFPNQDGLVRDRLLQRRSWKVWMSYRAFLICVLRR